MNNPFDDLDSDTATAPPPADASSQLDGQLTGALKGLGPAFVDAGQKNGIDPALLAAIAMHETGNGTSHALVVKNNAMGISPNNGGPARFESPVDSIEQQAHTLANNPAYEEWRKNPGDISALGSVYAPPDAPNDPYDQNKDWIDGVSKFYSRFKAGPAPASAKPPAPATASAPISEATPPTTPTPAATGESSPTNPFDAVDPAPATTTPAPAARPAASTPAPGVTIEANPFDALDLATQKPIWQPDPAAEAPVSAPASFVASADKSIVGAAGGALALSGKLVSLFDNNVDPEDDTTNPYMAAGHQLENFAQGYDVNLADKAANKAGNVVGGILPIIGSAPLAPLMAGAETAGSMYQDAEGKGADNRDAVLASLGGGAIVGAATLGLGPTGGKLLGEVPTLATSTWGGLGKSLAWGGLRSMARTYWDLAAQNVATGELTNTAVPDPLKESQWGIITSSLGDALDMAPVGAVTHALGQATADFNVGRIAATAGQDKAGFIADMSRFFDTLANNDAMTPQEKVAASSQFLSQFSKPARQVIAAHVQNVKTAMDSIQTAADSAARLRAAGAPLTANAKYQVDVQDAAKDLTKATQGVEAQADADEDSLAEDLKAAMPAPLATEPVEPAVPEPEPQPEQAAPPATPDAQTPAEEEAPPASEPVQPAADTELAPVESAVDTPPIEQASVPAPERAPSVAEEHANPFDAVDPRSAVTPPSEAAVEPAPVEQTEPQAPSDTDLDRMTRPQLIQVASDEGVSERVVKGAATNNLPAIIRAHRLGQTVTDRETGLSPDGEGAMVDPKIDLLPAKQKAAVKTVIDAAKAWGLRGVTKFVINTRSPNAIYTAPSAQHFDTVYINPNELAQDHANLRGTKAMPAKLKQIYGKVFSEEFGHLQAGKAIENDWKKAGSPGTFSDYYDDRMRQIYDGMTPAARNEAAKKYGGHFADINIEAQSSEYENKRLPAQLAEEYLRQIWQLRGSRSDTESLIRPDAAREAGESPQTKRLLKNIKSNKPLVRVIQSTVARLKGIAAKLAGRGTPDRQIEELIDRMDSLTRDAEKGGSKDANGAKPARFNPLAATASARPDEPFDYFSDLDEEPTGPGESDGGAGSPHAPTEEQQTADAGRPLSAEDGSQPTAGSPDSRGGQSGTVREVPDAAGRPGVGAGGTRNDAAAGGEGTRGASDVPVRGQADRPAITPYAESLLARREEAERTQGSANAVPLRPNESRRRAPGGHDFADAREQKLNAEIERLKDVAIPPEDQARFHALTNRLAQLQFHSNDVGRDRASGNAFIKVMLAAKRWSMAHGSIDNEDSHGAGFGARRIIQNALLDEGRRLAWHRRLFEQGETTSPEPADAHIPAPEVEETSDEPAAGPETRAFDVSEDDPEKIQEAFGEPPSSDPSMEGKSLDTPRKRAQDAAVDRNVQELRGTLSPHQREILRLWHESPDDPAAKYPKWTSEAQKQLGVTKEQALKDFQEVVQHLKTEAANRKLTKDDFTRITAAATPEESHDDEEGTRSLETEDAGGGPGGSPKGIADELRGKVGADPEKLGDYRTRAEQARRYLEIAQQRGKVLPPDFLAGKQRIATQGEHDVYDAGDRVFKVTRGHADYDNGTGIDQDYERTPWQYLNRFALGNKNLGDDTRWEGVIPENGHLRTVTSQKYLDGETPSQAEVEAKLAGEGYQRVARGRPGEPEDDVWHRPIDDTLIGDAKPKNWVKMPDGKLRPIDVISEQATAAQRAKYRLPTHDEGPSDAESDLVTPAARPEAFADRVADDERVNRTVRDAIYGRDYTPIPNEFTAAEALHTLNADGVDKTYDRVMEPDAAKTGLDARQRVTLGQQLMMRLQQSGNVADLSRAVNVAERMSTFGKDLGQAVQSFAIWSRLTAAGVLTKYARIIKPAIDAARLPHESTIGDIKDALQNTRRTSAEGTLGRQKIDEIVNDAEAISDHRLGVENAKPVWQRYQEATAEALSKMARGARTPGEKGALEAFGDRLTQNLKSLLNEKLEKGTASKKTAPLPAEAKLAEIYHNEPEYKEAWNLARVWVEAKYAKDQPTLDMFGDALNRAFQAPVKLHDEALRDELKNRNSTFRKVAKDGSAETVKPSVVNSIVDRLKLQPDHADRVRSELGDRFDALHKGATKANADAKARADQLRQAKKDAAAQGVPLWQRYTQGIADSLSKLVDGQKPSAAKPAMEEFAARARANLKGLITEDKVTTALEKPKLTAEQRFGEVYKNFPEYQQAWDEAKTAMLAKIGDDPAKRAEFEASLRKALDAPVALQDSVVNNALKLQGTSLRELVREWSANQDSTRDALVKGIQDRLALNPEQAARVGDVISRRFKIMLDQAREKELARVIKASGKPRLANQPKTIAQKIIEAVNLGATDDEAAYNAIADTYRLPKFDPAVAKDLSNRANEIQKMIADGKEGFQTDRKTSEMLNVLANQEDRMMPLWKKIGAGQMSVFYGNLFGPATIVRKSISEVSNFVSTISSMGIAEMRHGDMLALPRSFAAGIRGLIIRGAPDAANIMATGYGLRAGDHSFAYESKRVERGAIYSDVPVLRHLNKPLSALYKPVGRVLQAGAAFFYAGANEARANMLAYRMAKADQRAGRIPDEANIRQRLSQILGNTAEQRASATAQAASEGLTGREAKLRAAEIIEQSRPEDLRKQAAAFGARATYMQKPEGFMGALSGAVEKIGRDFPAFKLLVPVHRVVSNVFNNFLSYTPVGISGAMRMAREGDMDTAAQQYVKVALGGLSTIGAYALFSSPNGPQLYGGGPNDYQKNKQLRDSGWIPYSIKVGNRYISYREWPVSLMLASLGNYMDGPRYNGMGDKDAATRLTSALLATGRFSLSSSWISSASNLLTAFTSGNDKQTENSLKYAVGSAAGSLVPFNQKTFQTLDRLFDSNQYSSGDLAGMLGSQVAFARRLGQPTLNVLGEPVTQNPFSAFESVDKPDAVWQGLGAKGVWVPDIPKTEPLGDRTMTEDEHYRYVQESGAKIREALENGGLDKMSAMDRDQAQDYLNSITKTARSPVKAELRSEALEAGTIMSGAKPKGRR